MKLPSLFAFSVLLCIAHPVWAFGPAPFSQGNPLGSNDGTYQASARGTNLGGVIRFAIISGSQNFGDTPLTSDLAQRGRNSWAIFYEGKLYTGLTDASVMGNDIMGVLSAPISVPRAINNLQTEGGLDITGVLPTQSLIRGQNLSGFFEAKLNQKSALGSFKGDGELEVSVPPLYTYNLQLPTLPGAPAPGNNYVPSDPTTEQSQQMTESASQGVPDPNNPAAKGYGRLTSAPFKVRGTRTSTIGSTTSAGGLGN